MDNNFQISGIAAVLNQDDISTDIIAPASFLVTTSKSGLAKGLFYNWRYDKNGIPDNDFILNKQQFANASILITGENFGCGSSREHAVWALVESGFKAIIAPSFGQTFATNAAKNKLATITLPQREIHQICACEIIRLNINLKNGTITDNQKSNYKFTLTKQQISGLIEGIDDIEIALGKITKIEAHRKRFLIN